MQSIEPLVLTLTETATALHISEPTLRTLIREHRILTFRAGRRILVPRLALENMLMQTGEDTAQPQNESQSPLARQLAR